MRRAIFTQVRQHRRISMSTPNDYILQREVPLPITLPHGNVLDSSSITSPLVDTFDRYHNYLRISLTEKCNLRCVYCMPLEGVSLTQPSKLLTLDERKQLLSIFIKLGINKLRFTGGEPTISTHLKPLISHAHLLHVPFIGITTNGIVLKHQLNELVDVGLTSVNISLDSLNSSKFAEITRRDASNLTRVFASIYAAVEKNLKVKVNCVVMRGVNDTEIADFIRLSKELPIDVRFIELMPFDDNNWSMAKMMSYLEMLDVIKAQGIELTALKKKDKHDTTKWYSVKDHVGRVGFITSMTSHFCGGCNRLRVTADGHLKVCLFGDESFSLKNAFNDGLSEEEIVSKIHTAVKLKKAVLGGHGDGQSISQGKNRPMILIGG